jgi:hypothetical protein
VRIVPQRLTNNTDIATISVVVTSHARVTYALTEERERPLKAQAPKTAIAFSTIECWPPESKPLSVPVALRPGDALILEAGAETSDHKLQLVDGDAVIRSPAVSLSALAARLAHVDLDKDFGRGVRRDVQEVIKVLARLA